MDAPDFYAVLEFWFGAPGGVTHGQSRSEWIASMNFGLIAAAR